MADKKVEQLLGTLALGAAKPYGTAFAMPGAFYNDPGLLALEVEKLFHQEWVCVGRVEEVEKPGDFFTYRLGKESILVVRGQDGKLRALSNVCRHRGSLIAEGAGNRRLFSCPYHAWTYDGSGQLVGAPEIGQRKDFDKKNCSLPSFALEEWMGFLFVNLADKPKPLAPRLKKLEAMVRPYHLEQQRLRYLVEESWPINWKCFTENFMEGYHLTPLHRETLHPVNPTKLCEHYPAGDAYFGYYAGFSPTLPRSQKGHPDLNDVDVHRCVMLAVPPGMMSGCAGDYSSMICLQPDGPEYVKLKMGLIFFGENWPQATVDWAIDLFQKTMAEDKKVLVNMMDGMKSAHYRPGPLAPQDYEGPVLDLYRYLAKRLAKATVKAGATAKAGGKRRAAGRKK